MTDENLITYEYLLKNTALEFLRQCYLLDINEE